MSTGASRSRGLGGLGYCTLLVEQHLAEPILTDFATIGLDGSPADAGHPLAVSSGSPRPTPDSRELHGPQPGSENIKRTGLLRARKASRLVKTADAPFRAACHSARASTSAPRATSLPRSRVSRSKNF